MIQINLLADKSSNISLPGYTFVPADPQYLGESGFFVQFGKSQFGGFSRNIDFHQFVPPTVVITAIRHIALTSDKKRCERDNHSQISCIIFRKSINTKKAAAEKQINENARMEVSGN